MELTDNQLVRDIGILVVIGLIWVWMLMESKWQKENDRDFDEFLEKRNREKQNAEKNIY